MFSNFILIIIAIPDRSFVCIWTQFQRLFRFTEVDCFTVTTVNFINNIVFNFCGYSICTAEYKNNIAYEIDCSKCEAVYFGESKRSLKSCSDQKQKICQELQLWKRKRTICCKRISFNIQYIKKNVKASTSSKCILVQSFSLIFNTHAFENKILRTQEK